MKSDCSQIEFGRSAGTGVPQNNLLGPIREDSGRRTDTSWQAQLIVLDVASDSDRRDHRTAVHGARGVPVLQRTVWQQGVLQDA